MQPPAIPADEPLRLHSLREQALLDTPPEERFDRLTRLARQMFGVKMALVSLIDADRQWFKSRQGLDTCETGRDISFCGHAILGDEIFEVVDARADARFADNPLVAGPPHIRFYAGAPLAVAGHRIGTLCIIDAQARRLTADERQALRDLADTVQAEIGRTELLRQGIALEHAQRLGAAIVRAQSRFIAESDRRQTFDGLLADILALTGSAYGFIGEVLREAGGAPYLKTYALTNIAWNEETRAFYNAHAPAGMEFRNLETLFGATLKTGQPVIANDPLRDPRRGGLPPGHPPLDAFLGIPIYHGNEMVAMLGIANRPDGYSEAVIEFLQPLLATIGQLVEAARLRRRQLDSEARLRGLFELSPIGIALNDFETGAFLDVNAAIVAPGGYSREEFLALSYWDLTPREYEAKEAQQLVSLRLIGRYGPYEKEYIRKNGSRYPVRLIGMAVADPAGRKLIWSMVEDISEQRRMERLKGEFVSAVSHELRTPLTSIAGALGLVAGGALGELPAQMRQMIEIAHNNSQRLTFLIDDLLDMDKLMAGKMRFDMRVQPLAPLLDRSLLDNRGYADRHGVGLRLADAAGEVAVEVDAQRLLQILANLLSNAIKFSPQGGTVELSARRTDGRVRLAVADRGPGIPAAFHDRVFEKFSQADASDARRTGGTGLGLAISKELVERVGGTIGFESDEGAGTTFWVDLPLPTT